MIILPDENLFTMNNYITGAGGFIGKHLTKKLGSVNNSPDAIDLKAPFNFFHLSAYGNHHFQKSISETVKANVSDLLYWVNVTKNNNLVKFYNFSTSSVTLKHQTPYSVSKLLGEKIIESLNDRRFVNIRPYSVYGEGEAEHRFIPTVIQPQIVNFPELFPSLYLIRRHTQIFVFFPCLFFQS